MNDFAKVFAQQNPKMTFNCENCHNEFTVSTMELFKKKEMTYCCKHCKASITLNAKQLMNDIEKELKKIGISVK